ncbi:hypothetical protein [Priestia megaterium]|uniref:hypothetical protein n=1 Tax=Priestia megaterium TaxID=1404 RepID=UPI000BFCF4FA|nr:hypothetical protein [Priestia megaterium]PGO60761.1 hypothetical protein CN981_09500 [Priestia megaterium]
MKKYLTRLWFKFLLSRKKLIKVDDRHRGVGKTTMMISTAQKGGHSIVVGKQSAYDLIKEISKDVNVFRLAENYTFELKGKEGTILIDESLSPKMVSYLEMLPEWEIVGGFIQKEVSENGK